MHRGILFFHQSGITTLAPAWVIESLLGHGQARATLAAGTLQCSTLMVAALTPLQARCSTPVSGVGKRTGKQKQGRELMTKKLPGTPREERIMPAA